MDIQMPVMGGFEATEKILRERPTTVVALTSYTA
jgi:CheY-like chemotaxis protein